MATFNEINTKINEARELAMTFIKDTLTNMGGEINLEKMPLVYVDQMAEEGERIHTTYAERMFIKDDAVYIESHWYDECGYNCDGNESLFALTANELYDIASRLNSLNK